MKLIHRKIDFVRDKEYVLERHCRINYECDTPWKREMPYDAYRREWFSLQSQIDGFWEYMKRTTADSRTIADIIETEDGEAAAYLWVPFCEDKESGFAFADVQDLYIEEPYRRRGMAETLMSYAEDHARWCGADVIRSGTGCENIPSVNLHGKLGYYQYRYEFEKVLK